jgi:hypothetical protein
MIYPKLTDANYVDGYCVELAFADGSKAVVDFKDEISGGIFEDLQDISYFRSFRVHHQFGTIEWDNGADFSPEFLYELAKNLI